MDVPEIQWFGISWNSKINAKYKQVPPPVGVPCLGCNKPIAADDVGVCLWHVCDTQSYLPWHLDCLKKTILG